jgi:hypothetical protein
VRVTHSTTGAAATASSPPTQPAAAQTYAAPVPRPHYRHRDDSLRPLRQVGLPGIAATLHQAIGTGTPNPPYSPAEAKLFQDDSKLSRWSYLVESKADNATFANYLGDAGAALGVVGAPDSTSLQADTAAEDVGRVNG